MPLHKKNKLATPKRTTPESNAPAMPEQTHDPKSFWPSNDGLADAIRDLHRFLAEHMGAITKRDLENTVNQSEDRLMAVLQEIKGNMATIKEQLDAQEAKLTSIGEDVDAIVTSVNGINTDVQTLKKQIEDFQNSPGELTPENQASFDRIQTLVNTIASKTTGLKTATAELDAATEAGGSGDGGPTPPS